MRAEWTVFKRSNEEMRGRVEKQENELAELRDALSEKRKQLDNVEDERTRLKHKCAQLEIDLEALHAEFAAFQNGAEMQYQAEMAQLKEIIHEKDERLDRLHTRIAEYESYPGMNSSIVLSEGSSAAANTTLWDMMPEELREQFQLLRQRYNELDAMVQKMMESHIAANNESFGRHSKVMENKMTDCDDLMRPSPERPLSGGMQSGHELAAVAVASNMDAVSERTLSEGVQPSNMDVSATANDNIQSIIGGLLRSVRMAEVNGKLTPNIRQLLDMLLTDVARSSLSAECIDEAVNRFFANLDLALRRTLSTSDDNRRRCEELENARAEALEERRVMSEELRAAQDRYAIFEAKAETLKLQLKEEGRKVIELRNEIEQLTQHIHRLDTSNTGLKGIVTQQQMEIDEKAAACRKSAEYLEDFRIELEKMGVYADMLNERLRQANREKEDLKRRLGDRDCEMARLEERLVDSINQCTTRASDVQKFEKRLAAAQLQNDTLKRKYDKRETFLEQMEALLRAMKVRNDALREANRLRQNKLDVVMKFLARHGIDVGEGFDVRPRSALDEEQEEGHNLEAKGASGDVNDSVRNSVGPVDISDAAVARLMRRLDRYTSQIEMREREGAIDDIRIPSWRSISESTSSRCGSESGDPHPNVDSTPSNPPENLLINSP
ncbi:unnamed protein product [Toxocara canis]|uniref:Uncharacterized protein n=1 Tax=Toxocara canis TaxID=6265 RepID=A0A183TVW9_TOXCA|nr:unnamed protein product [Toxocara canis]